MHESFEYDELYLLCPLFAMPTLINQDTLLTKPNFDTIEALDVVLVQV